jgi:deoxyadenosine/deoxycytidine kinase
VRLKHLKDKRKLFIAIAGNIGAGKTSLTRLLSQALGWRAHYEKIVDNPYLIPFYDDMPRWSFHLQIYFLTHRFKAQKEIANWPDSCLQDRTIYEDGAVFAKTLHERGCMSDRDYENYRLLFSTMTEHIYKPDLIIYLQAPLEKLIDSILKRGRDFEQTIDPDYLGQLNRAYDEWAGQAGQEGLSLLTVDTRNKNFEEHKEDLEMLVSHIREMEKQSWLGVD